MSKPRKPTKAKVKARGAAVAGATSIPALLDEKSRVMGFVLWTVWGPWGEGSKSQVDPGDLLFPSQASAENALKDMPGNFATEYLYFTPTTITIPFAKRKRA